MVCGGAGYIGSHVAKRLAGQGHRVTVLDNLSTGHREALRFGEFVHTDLHDAISLDRAFGGRNVDVVMHFCASSLVGESVAEPIRYYWNNVAGTVSLLQAMLRHGVSRMIFSSSAAIFGMPDGGRIEEDAPTLPVNPYGRSKLMVETILRDAAATQGLSCVSLRYFNAAGASPDSDIGESHQPETHLIPNVLRAALERGETLRIFGDDYPTQDGTCIRDYVHVDDLADAHIAAIRWMDSQPGMSVFNLGNGNGFSVREVVDAARRVTGLEIPFTISPRRPGDPANLVASSELARQKLGWTPRYTTLDGIIETAWRWHRDQAF